MRAPVKLRSEEENVYSASEYPRGMSTSSGSPISNRDVDCAESPCGGVAARARPRRFLVIFALAAVVLGLAAVSTSTALASPPLNDDFANAEALVGPSAEFNGSLVGATIELGEPGAPDPNVTGTVWYKWTAPGSGIATASIGAPALVFTGASLETLDQVANLFLQPEEFIAESGVTYYIIAANAFGVFDAFSGSIHLNPDPGSISGTVTDSASNPIEGLAVTAYSPSGFATGGSTYANGNYKVIVDDYSEFEPHDYRVTFGETMSSPVNSTMISRLCLKPARWEFFRGNDTPGVDAELAAAGSISGNIACELCQAGKPINPQEDFVVRVFDSAGDWGWQISPDANGNYRVGGLGSGNYRLLFGFLPNQGLNEFYDNKPDLASANLVEVKVGSDTPDIDAVLGQAAVEESKAKISKVSARGPKKVKKGKKATYKVKIEDSGNAEATGVKLNVKGKGVTAKRNVGTIPAGSFKDGQGQAQVQEAGQGEGHLQGDLEERRWQDREEEDQGQEVAGTEWGGGNA